jgi:hypothetical protein
VAAAAAAATAADPTARKRGARAENARGYDEHRRRIVGSCPCRADGLNVAPAARRRISMSNQRTPIGDLRVLTEGREEREQ